MKLRSKHIFAALTFLFFLILPFERRHIFFSLGYQFGDFAAISFYLSDIFAIILGILGIAQLWRTGNGKHLPRGFGLFVLLIVFEALISPRDTFTTFFSLKMLEMAGIWLFFAQFWGESQGVSYATLLGLAISASLQALAGIGQFLKQRQIGLHVLGENVLSTGIAGIAKIDTQYGKLIRSYGTFAHPNQLAAFLCVACVTTLVLLRTVNNQYRRAILMSCVIFMVLAETLTFSRAGWLAILLELGLFLYLSRDTWVNLVFKRQILTVSAAILFSMSVAWPYLGSRITLADQSLPNHLTYDKAGIELFLKHPIFGAGLGQLMPAISKLENAAQPWQLQPPHNYFLIVACETGVVGLAVIIYIFGETLLGLIRQLKKGDREQQIFKYALFSIFLGALLLMQFDHYFYTLQQTQLLIWSIIGIISGTVLEKENSGL